MIDQKQEIGQGWIDTGMFGWKVLAIVDSSIVREKVDLCFSSWAGSAGYMHFPALARSGPLASPLILLCPSLCLPVSLLIWQPWGRYATAMLPSWLLQLRQNRLERNCFQRPADGRLSICFGGSERGVESWMCCQSKVRRISNTCERSNTGRVEI